jgi:hypothetical protein
MHALTQRRGHRVEQAQQKRLHDRSACTWSEKKSSDFNANE